MPANQRERTPRRRDQSSPSSSWVATTGSNIYYRPLSYPDKPLPSRRFPAPLIGPRRTRPFAIHILTYPSGYVPRELRVSTSKTNAKSTAVRKFRKRIKNRTSRVSRPAAQPTENPQRRDSPQEQEQPQTQPQQQQQQPLSSIRPALGKLTASFPSNTLPTTGSSFGLDPTRTSAAGNDSSFSDPPILLRQASSSIDSASAGRSQQTRISPTLPAYDVIQQQRLHHDSPHLHLHHNPHRRQRPLSLSLSLSLSRSLSPQNLGTDSSVVSNSSLAPSQPVAHHQHHRPTPLTHRHSLCCTNPGQAQIRPQHHQHPNYHSRHHSLQDFRCLGRPDNTADSSPPDPQPLQRQRLNSTPQSQSAALSHQDPTMAGRIAMPPNAYHLGGPTYSRNSLMAVRSAKSAVSSLVTEVPKPVASGSGVTCSILLAEPNVFLTGFDHHDHSNGQREGQSGTALLRGKLQLNVSKNVKIKAVQLKLLGRARTEWPEGIPPLKQDLHEEEGLRTQVLTFFNAMNEGWETDYGNQCTYQLKGSSANSSTTHLETRPGFPSPVPSSSKNLTAKDLKRLSLQNVQSRSFNKENSAVASSTQVKGFKVFYPGTYDYSFELPIDHHQLETIKLQYGSVKWELHATVDRAGAFKPNLHGMKEVSIVRLPDQLSLEMTEPISISRQWEDQLHYDIIISGKSFPIGGKIPIAFKLTPLAKVQVHKLKVFVTESVEYWTNDKRVTRKDPGRKILLLEKSAGKPLDPVWASSEMRTVRGGELTPEQRREARDIAARRRSSSRSGPAPLPDPTENILGDLDLGLESYWGSTEIEANVQIPTCEMMSKNKDFRLHPDCSWKNVNVYHWIKIVMRISRLDPDDPSGTKRRHFEISIDSPFTILNCRATQANTNLPAYTGSTFQPSFQQSSCGCPDASVVRTDISPNSSTGTLPGAETNTSDSMPAPPQAAHLHTTPMNPASSTQTPPQSSADGAGSRPIHLLRAPSYNPPAFDEDSAPPPAPETIEQVGCAATNLPLPTPPPEYDVIVGTPSVDGLADYFARLADYGLEDHDDSGSDSDETPPRILERTGRVNVAHPRTPGGRMPSRSLEISRPPVNLNLSSLPNRANRATEATG